MAEYDLIPDEAYEGLPEEENDKFVKLVGIAQANLGRLLDQSSSSDYRDEIKSQFISTVTSIAEALRVEGLPKVSLSVSSYKSFQVGLAGVMAKARLQGGLIAKPFLFSLAGSRVKKLGRKSASYATKSGNQIYLSQNRCR